MGRAWVLIVAAVVAGGCRKGAEQERGGAPRDARATLDAASVLDAAVPVDASAAADAAMVRGGPDDPMAEKLRHCPVAVEGAATVMADVAGGIAMTVTAADEAAAAEIRRRAAHMVAFTAGQAKGGEHGGGAGGGFMQNCPVVARATLIEATEVAGGARLLVRPTAGLTVEALRAETRRRYAAFAAP